MSSEYRVLLGRLSPLEIVEALASSELFLSIGGARPRRAFLRVSDVGEKVVVGPDYGCSLIVGPQRLLRRGLADGSSYQSAGALQATIDDRIFEFYASALLMKDYPNGLSLQQVSFSEYLSRLKGVSKAQGPPFSQRLEQQWYCFLTNSGNQPRWTFSLKRTYTPTEGPSGIRPLP